MAGLSRRDCKVATLTLNPKRGTGLADHGESSADQLRHHSQDHCKSDKD